MTAILVSLLVSQFLYLQPLGAGFTTNAALAKTFSLDEKGTTIRNLLQSMTQETGVTLSADRHNNDQRIQMRLVNRSAKEIMDDLAALTDSEWVADKTGYELVRNEKSVSYQKAWWRIYNAERKRALESAAQSIVTQMSQDTPSGSFFVRSKFWQQLPLLLKEKVAHLYVAPTTYRLIQGNTWYTSNGGLSLPFSSLPESCQAEVFKTSDEAVHYHLQQVDQLVIRGVGSHFDVEDILPNGAQGSTGIEFWYPDLEENPALILDQSLLLPTSDASDEAPIPHDALAKTLRDGGGKVPLAWQKLVAYQKKTVWQNEAPQNKLPTSPVVTRNIGGKSMVVYSGTPVPPRFPDTLAHVASAFDAEYLSDYYSLPSRPLTEAERTRKAEQPLSEELNQLAKIYDVSWKKATNGVLLVRHNRWYRNDLLEVPPAVIKRLTLVEKSSTLPSGTDPEVAQLYQRMCVACAAQQELTPWQSANGLFHYIDEKRLPPPAKQDDPSELLHSDCQPFSDTSEWLMWANHLCDFFGSLSKTDRVRLLTDGIPLAALSPAERQMLDSAAPGMAANLSPQSTDVVRLTHDGMYIATQPCLWGNAYGSDFGFIVRLERKPSPAQSDPSTPKPVPPTP